MRQLVEDLVKQYGGGQPYFTELDNRIRKNRDLREALLAMAGVLFENIEGYIVSGAFGMEFYGYSLVWVPGGLRNGEAARFHWRFPSGLSRELDVSELPDRLVFVDDSFYKGRTYDAVRAATRGRVIGAVVAYDGSWEPTPGVFSLYRWRDRCSTPKSLSSAGPSSASTPSGASTASTTSL